MNYNSTRRNLVAYFGYDRKLSTITKGDVDDFRVFMRVDEGLADNTVRRRMGISKQFFQAAVRKKIIPENPFLGHACSVRENHKRFYFLKAEDAKKVLDACPDIQWKLIFALARWGGLRCPSEILRLKWEDINWEQKRFTVHASKTEHHADGGIRQVPIFPELMPLFLEAFETAPEGESFVISKYRSDRTNLRTKMCRIIKRAGMTPWPKLFQNLRSTRETELAETFPIHVVCKWIGNSPLIAARHYLQTCEEHFQLAAGGGQHKTLVENFQ